MTPDQADKSNIKKSINSKLSSQTWHPPDIETTACLVLISYVFIDRTSHVSSNDKVNLDISYKYHGSHVCTFQKVQNSASMQAGYAFTSPITGGALLR